jgi:DNA-binding LytR/AlgR family response regulator
MTTAVLVEDEPLLRKRLRSLLEAYWADLKIVAEAGDGIEGLAAVHKWKPDVVFLDIQMPKLSGIEVAHAIRGQTHIVFLTAHSDHAVDAFSVGAVDYLLKPIQPDRLLDTIQRIRSKAVLVPQLAPMPFLAPKKYLSWIQASVGSSLHLVTVEDVFFFQSDSRYTRVVTESKEYFVRKTIKELTDELNPEHFVQVSRGCVVNLRKIESIAKLNGQMEISLKSRPELICVTPGYQSAFRQM